MQETLLKINVNNIKKNALRFKKLTDDRFLYAVVKADAYGHGDIAVVNALQTVADGFAVARPHCERAAALSYKEERGNPPFFAEEKGCGDAGGGKAKFHKPEVDGFFAFIAERENNSAQYAENIEQHSRPRGEERKLHRESDTASHLEKEIVAVFLALVRGKGASRADVAYKLNRGEYPQEKFCHFYHLFS
jgi:hypothetical protein